MALTQTISLWSSGGRLWLRRRRASGPAGPAGTQAQALPPGAAAIKFGPQIVVVAGAGRMGGAVDRFRQLPGRLAPDDGTVQVKLGERQQRSVLGVSHSGDLFETFQVFQWQPWKWQPWK